METFVTLRELEQSSGVSRARLDYACQAYRIEPVRRAGLVKLYAVGDVQRILSAAKRIANRRGGEQYPQNRPVLGKAVQP